MVEVVYSFIENGLKTSVWCNSIEQAIQIAKMIKIREMREGRSSVIDISIYENGKLLMIIQ